MSAEQKLKTCPYCGGDNVAPRHETVDYMAMHYFVMCLDCMHRGPIIWAAGRYNKEYEHKSIVAWNKGSR